jgi:hypothetical protein
MNTPTDDEIVAQLLNHSDWTNNQENLVRETLRLAREGLPVKDEVIVTPNREDHALAYRLWSVHPKEVQDIGLTRDAWYACEIAKYRTFLADRDAERDEAVAELVKAATYTRNWLKNSGYHNEWTKNLSAALAKLERKP